MAGVTDLINAIQFQQQNRQDVSPFSRIGQLLQQELAVQRERQIYANRLADAEKQRNSRREEYMNLISRKDLPSGLKVSSDNQGRISYQFSTNQPRGNTATLYKSAWGIAKDMAGGDDADIYDTISNIPKAVKVLTGDYADAIQPWEEDDLEKTLGELSPGEKQAASAPPSAGVGPALQNIKKKSTGGSAGPISGSTVNIAMPDGQIWAVPRNKVAEAIKRGGKIAK